jgi:D-threo-aldose 1-dehydrogenase
MAPYTSFLLGYAPPPGHFYNYAPADDAVLEKARRFYDVCAQTGSEVGATALQFPLAHPAVVSVVCGLRSAAEVDSAATRLQADVPAATWSALRAAGLLLDGVPTP